MGPVVFFFWGWGGAFQAPTQYPHWLDLVFGVLGSALATHRIERHHNAKSIQHKPLDLKPNATNQACIQTTCRAQYISIYTYIYAYRERKNANSVPLETYIHALLSIHALRTHLAWYRYGSFILTSKGEFASNLEAEDQINLPTQQAGKHIHPDKHKTIHTPFYNLQKVWKGWHPTRNSKPNQLVTTSKDASAYQGLNIVTLQGQHTLHHMTHATMHALGLQQAEGMT